jgi:hypothetical protein
MAEWMALTWEHSWLTGAPALIELLTSTTETP